jgi:Domain of unknown function (DUF4116)
MSLGQHIWEQSILLEVIKNKISMVEENFGKSMSDTMSLLNALDCITSIVHQSELLRVVRNRIKNIIGCFNYLDPREKVRSMIDDFKSSLEAFKLIKFDGTDVVNDTVTVLSSNIMYNIYEKLQWHDLKNINNKIANNRICWRKKYINFFGWQSSINGKKDFFFKLYSIIIDCIYNDITSEIALNNYLSRYPWLINDPIIVDIMLKSHSNFIKFLPPKFKNDRNFILNAVKNGSNFYYIPEDLKHDQEIVYAGVRRHPFTYEYIPLQFKQHRALALMAVKADG